jgi:hypothetical protein
MAYVVVTAGQSAGNSFGPQQVLAQRGPDVTQDVQLLDLQVSRRHFVLSRADE